MSTMTPPGAARRAALRAARRAAGVARAHKVITGITALFVAAFIVVPLVTSSSSAKPADPAAPGFTLPVLGQADQQVSLSQYQGKPLIINFWASWCPPCQQETPLLASWYKQEHGRVVLLGLDENDTTAAALKFARAKGVTYPIGFNPQTNVALAYNVDELPQTFFLNAQHRIVDHVLGAVTEASLTKGLRLMNSAS